MTDIEKLTEIIEEIDALISNRVTKQDAEFKKWHNKTKRFLFKCYGAENLEYTEFCKLSFSLRICTGTTERYRFVQRCREDLVIAKAFLQDHLIELSEDDSNDCDSCNLEKKLERIFIRFRKVAVQLSRRYNGRNTLIINDEYDVQDLLHALLRLYFDDVRPEEWTPSYAGSSVRIDFLIPEIKTVIEVKKTRPSMTDKSLSEELIIDIEKYQNHPMCTKIYCFVYDPNTILRNPAAIKNDLEKKHSGLVKVFIES